MITLNTCHAVHPPYGILKCPAGRGQPQFLKHFPRRNAPRTIVMGPSGRLARKRCCACHHMMTMTINDQTAAPDSLCQTFRKFIKQN